jgi:hypothetical protein
VCRSKKRRKDASRVKGSGTEQDQATYHFIQIRKVLRGKISVLSRTDAGCICAERIEDIGRKANFTAGSWPEQVFLRPAMQVSAAVNK